jgi:hypothetical protein
MAFPSIFYVIGLFIVRIRNIRMQRDFKEIFQSANIVHMLGKADNMKNFIVIWQ